MQGAPMPGGEADRPADAAREDARAGVLMCGTGRAGDVVRCCPRTT